MNITIGDDIENLLYKGKKVRINKSRLRGWDKNPPVEHDALMVEINGKLQLVSTRDKAVTQKYWSDDDKRQYPEIVELLRIAKYFDLDFFSFLSLFIKYYFERFVIGVLLFKMYSTNDFFAKRGLSFQIHPVLLELMSLDDNKKIVDRLTETELKLYLVDKAEIKEFAAKVSKGGEDVSEKIFINFAGKLKSPTLQSEFKKRVLSNATHSLSDSLKKYKEFINSREKMNRDSTVIPDNVYYLYDGLKYMELDSFAQKIHFEAETGFIFNGNRDQLVIKRDEIIELQKLCMEVEMYKEEMEVAKANLAYLYTTINQIISMNVLKYSCATNEIRGYLLNRTISGLGPDDDQEIKEYLAPAAFRGANLEASYIADGMENMTRLTLNTIKKAATQFSFSVPTILMFDGEGENFLIIPFRSRDPDSETTKSIQTFPTAESPEQARRKAGFLRELTAMGWKIMIRPGGFDLRADF